MLPILFLASSCLACAITAAFLTVAYWCEELWQDALVGLGAVLALAAWVAFALHLCGDV